MNNHAKYKNLRILRVFEIEKDYRKHKDRLMRIQTNMPSTINRDKEQRVQHINTFKRHKLLSEVNKAKDRDAKLVHENLLIHESLKKVYLRKNSLRSLSRDGLNSSKSERSLMRERNRSIEEENLRMHRKLISTRSSINRDKQIAGYVHNQPIRDRLTAYTPKKKDEVRRVLQRKFNLNPTVLFPRMRSAAATPDSSKKASRSYLS